MYSWLIKIYQRLRDEGFEDPVREIIRIADIASGGKLADASPGFLEKSGVTIDQLVEMRKEGKPIEYILGEAPFMGVNFHCAPGALIPRAETEMLTKRCLALIGEMQIEKPEIIVVEIGTGSGNIAVSLALHTSNAKILASDISREAVDVAARNVERFGVGEKVKLFCGNLFDPIDREGVEGKVDLVVCNPPYIPTSSLEKLDSSITGFEPVVALDAGAYGIDIFRRLLAESPVYLRPGGALAFEIGAGQDKIVTRLFKKSGFYEKINTVSDGDKIRVFSAVRK
ncbi:MAG: peptide chain release factor N(5)-glutamine methyltransferase [Candidatus Krumholzibacteriota bacterium]|nr:peptide chain release factor N(5)-glutamine methyltransferase [Candidatus Krumholzibacteriota bacterium]